MKTTTTLSSLALVLALGCASAPPRAVPSPAVLGPDVTARGDSIYFGTVFPLEGGGREALYVYERRVDDTGPLPIATHVTRDLAGRVVLADSATHTPGYRLVSYTLLANQIGQTGTVKVEGRRVSFRLDDGRTVRRATEEVTDPVVVGPTLIGTIVTHLDALRAGEVVPVRMAILDRLETLGFHLSAEPAARGRTRVTMTASSPIIALAVDPVTFVFDDATRHLVRLEGRVPPRVLEGEDWADLDARVEYRPVAALYR